MPSTLMALQPDNQPRVNDLVSSIRPLALTISARNWRTTAADLSANISQLYTLTGEAL